MINISIKRDVKDNLIPSIRLDGNVSLTINEYAVLIYMLETGIYTALIWDELSKSIDEKHLNEIQTLLIEMNNKGVDKFNLIDFLTSNSSVVLNEAKIPIIDNDSFNHVEE